jgi:hypothetical protein
LQHLGGTRDHVLDEHAIVAWIYTDLSRSGEEQLVIRHGRRALVRQCDLFLPAADDEPALVERAAGADREVIESP